MLTADDVLEVLQRIERNTKPTNGQRALTLDQLYERAADWLEMLQDLGVSAEELNRAARTCIMRDGWKPEIAAIIAELRPPEATRDDVASTADGDLVYLRQRYHACVSRVSLEQLAAAMLPTAGQPMIGGERERTTVEEHMIGPDGRPLYWPRIEMVDGERKAVEGQGRPMMRTVIRQVWATATAADGERHDRMAAALERIGGAAALAEAMRAEDGERARLALGHSWRAAYQSQAGVQARSAPHLRVLEGGRAGDVRELQASLAGLLGRRA